MVLDNATSADAPFVDDLPSSDLDPYANESSSPFASSSSTTGSILVSPSPNPIYVDLNTLPRRLGDASHPKFLVDGIKDSCRFAEQTVLKRSVTQDEADAFAWHFAKSVRIASYGGPVGLLAGAGMAYRSRASYRFPGWTPFKEGGRLSKDAFGPLKGQLARVMWQTLRLSAYSLVGVGIGQIFFGSYALSVSLAGRARDPKLKEFTNKLRAMQRDGQGKPLPGNVDYDGAGPKPNETFDMARQRRGVQAMGRRGAGQDDASPSAGAYGDEHLDTSADVVFQSEDEVRRQADAMVASSRSNSPAPTQPRSTRPTPREPSGEATEPSGGSAWGRLRQEALGTVAKRAPIAGGARTSAGSSPTSGNDEFGFSSADSQSAKSDAQREFDARLERERAGGDFEDKSQGRKRW